MEFVVPQLGQELGIIVAVAIFALYVSLGGFWAVTWTDFIQGIVIVVLALAPLPFVLLDFGGPGAVLAESTAVDPQFLGVGLPALSILGAVLVWLLSPLGLPQFGQRILSSKSDRVARRGIMWMTVIMFVTFVVNVLFLAGAAKALQPDLADPDFFYYAVLEAYTGPILQGLGAGALLAAVMSTTDALLIALSASLSHDIPETLGWELGSRQETLLGVGTIWGGAALAALVALDPPGIIFALTTMVAGGAASGLFPALAIGTWWKRANKYGAIASMVVGFVVYVVLLLAQVVPVFGEVLIAVPLGFAAFIGVPLATRRPTVDELQGFRSFHTPTRESHRADPSADD